MNRWVVICGAIRNSLEFNAVLAKALDFRKNQLVSEIVLSTWVDEIDRVEGLRGKLKNFGVHTVEAHDVPVPGPQNIWRQFRSYDVGIRACPYDAEILRARTDKCYVYFDMWKRALSTLRFDLPQDPKFTVFPGRIYVPYLSLSALFFCKDIFFYGRKQSLDLLTHYENWSNAAGNEIDWAELRWFIYPFLQRFPILRDVLETVSFKGLSTAICTKPNLPTVVCKILGIYFRLLKENITPMNYGSEPDEYFIEDLIFGTGGISHIATIPDGKFSSHMAPWVFEKLGDLGKAKSHIGEKIRDAFFDETLPFSWARLSYEERLELAAFAGSDPRMPRYTFVSGDRSELTEDEVLDLVSTNILQVEHEISREALKRDRFSPILECIIASYWYRNQNTERGNYWFKKALTNRAVFDYDEGFETLVRYARAEWLKESQPEFVQISERSNIGSDLIEEIISPGKRTRIDNLILLSTSINNEILPESMVNFIFGNLILLAERINSEQPRSP